MSVLEYANDVDKKIEDILTLCKKIHKSFAWKTLFKQRSPV